MSTENMGIEKGMKVYGANGEDLGEISHIWTDVGESPSSPQNYFVVSEGGFLGFGERSLYIPFEAVESVVPGESVSVACSKEEVIDLHGSKPEGIRKKEVMIAEGAVVASTTPVIFH